MFNLRNWYWLVGTNGRLFSSKHNDYVELDDAGYVAWQGVYGMDATPIPDEDGVLYYMHLLHPE